MTAATPRRLQPKAMPRAQRRTTTRPRFPAELEEALRARCHGRCECCGKPLRARHRHHRRMRSQGGLDVLSNLVMICPGCHNTIHLNPMWAYEHGWLVKSTTNPARRRLLLAGGRVVRLGDDGTYRDVA